MIAGLDNSALPRERLGLVIINRGRGCRQTVSHLGTWVYHSGITWACLSRRAWRGEKASRNLLGKETLRFHQRRVCGGGRGGTERRMVLFRADPCRLALSQLASTKP